MATVNCALSSGGTGRAKWDAMHHNGFCVGGLSVSLRGVSRADVSLTPPLEPFRTEPNAADIDIEVEWIGRLVETSAPKLFDSGSVWRLYRDQAEFQFDFRVPTFGDQPYKRLLVDPRFFQA